MSSRRVMLLAAAASCMARPALAQGNGASGRSGDSIRIHLVDVEYRAAVQALAQYVDRPVVFGVPGGSRVTLDVPQPVARQDVIGLLRTLVTSQNQELVLDSSGVYRVRSREQRVQPAAPLVRQTGPPELFVIHLTHARAADVAATVNALYGRAGALGEAAGPGPTLADQLRQNQVPPRGPQPELVQGAAGRVAQLSGEVTIVPDAGTNSLLIRASRGDFELIQAAVQELDVRPLQVLIEVMIAEIRRDRSLGVGLSSVLGRTEVGTHGTAVQGSVTGLSLGDAVLQVMNAGGHDLTASLNASAARGDAYILSRPVVLAANNERAVINVGSQRPFIQVSRSLPTDVAQRDQVVEYKDVGTRLSVRPTISGNGYVTLEVSQEVNAATSEFAFDAPVISTRSVQTQLLIRDGQTVILGGLADRQREIATGGVPLLSDLPLIGWVFGRRTRSTTSTELFLFITPHIIQSDADADSLTAPRRERARQVEP